MSPSPGGTAESSRIFMLFVDQRATTDCFSPFELIPANYFFSGFRAK